MSNNVKDDYIPPVFLSDEARDLNDRFYLILNNLVASFPYAKMNPNDPTVYNTNITNQVLICLKCYNCKTIIFYIKTQL